MVEDWLDEPEEVPIDRDILRRDTHARIEQWNAIGRQICSGFLGVVERLRLAA
jgi:hypothetical protein